MTLRQFTALGLAAVLTLCASGGARAGNLVQNGSFESNGGPGELGYNTYATDWSVSGGYSTLFAPGTADTIGSNGQYGNVALWGPGNGVNNGLPATSPDGGYFLAQDGWFDPTPIQQTINGLTPGDTYQVGFWWAASQQEGSYGATQQNWQVSLGGETFSTPVYDLPSQGFSGWMYQTFDFTADNTSDVLSFLAVGNLPLPPFLLLDGVSMNAVPEPGAVALMGLGVLGMGLIRLRSRARSRAA